MAKVDKKYIEIAKRMMDHEKNLKIAQQGYERLSRIDGGLPSPLDKWDWLIPIPSTASYDALRGAVRPLANNEPSISVHPITVSKLFDDDDSKAAKTAANYWEMALKWNLLKTSKRRKSIVEDMVWSAAVYDLVIAQIIHVPTQAKAQDLEGIRKEAALLIGDWAVKMCDPKTIYIEWSNFGVERVLSVNVRTARYMVDNYGEEVDFIRARLRSGKLDYNDEYVEYDLVSHKGRIIWVAEGSNIIERDGRVILPLQPWLKKHDSDEQVPFLPYSISAGGTSVDMDPEFQYKPLLFSVYRAELDVVQTIMGTLMMSQAIAAQAGAKDVLTGAGAEDVVIDYTDVIARINLAPHQTYAQFQSEVLDRALREGFEMIGSAIQRTTVSDVLVTAQPLSGEQAYASYNMQVTQALASLGGIKMVAGNGIAGIVEMFLLIAHYTGNNIVGYGEDNKKYEIDSEDIDPNSIEINVQLKGDVAADRQQRILGAQQLTEMGYSRRRSFAMLGDTDPEGAMKEAQLEQMDDALFQQKLRRLFSEEYQQDVMAAAQAIVEQQMQQAQAQQGAPQGAPAGPTFGGQGENPAAGGQPPVMTNPPGVTEPRREGEQPLPVI